MFSFIKIVRELYYVKEEIKIFCKCHLHYYIPLDALWNEIK